MTIQNSVTVVKTVTKLAPGPVLAPAVTKASIIRLKNSSLCDKGELQRLNVQLRNYLEDVKRLEELNFRLIEEVERTKAFAMPRIVDKTHLDDELKNIRLLLEDVSNGTVHFKLQADEKSAYCENLSHRLRFFQQEGDIQKQKIFLLQSQLNEIVSQRDFLISGSRLAVEEIERERARQFESERTLEHLRITLNEAKAKNKAVEFQTNTLMEEVEFRKALFLEESNYLRTRFNGTILSGTELTNFYKHELAIAIRQIRQDFVALNEQQMREYKDLKEKELARALKTVEEEKILQQQAMIRLEHSMDIEFHNAHQLKCLLGQMNGDYEQLKACHNMNLKRLEEMERNLEELKRRNSSKVAIIEAEINAIKEQNQVYANELEYWDRVTRSKLESEIVTYRSLLNSQVKFMQANAPIPRPILVHSRPHSPLPPPPPPPVGPVPYKNGKVVVTTVVTEQVLDENGNVIDTRQRTVPGDEMPEMTTMKREDSFNRGNIEFEMVKKELRGAFDKSPKRVVIEERRPSRHSSRAPSLTDLSRDDDYLFAPHPSRRVAHNKSRVIDRNVYFV